MKPINSKEMETKSIKRISRIVFKDIKTGTKIKPSKKLYKRNKKHKGEKYGD